MSRVIENAKLIYELQPGERYAFLRRANGMVTIIVAHPEREPKIVHTDGRIEIIKCE